MLVKAKKTLPNCDLIKSGGFADETTTESSQGSDVHLLESTHEETDTPLYYMLLQLVKAVLLDHLGRGALSVATEKQAEEFICRVYSPFVTDYFRNTPKIEKSFRLPRVVFPNI